MDIILTRVIQNPALIRALGGRTRKILESNLDNPTGEIPSYCIYFTYQYRTQQFQVVHRLLLAPYQRQTEVLLPALQYYFASHRRMQCLNTQENQVNFLVVVKYLSNEDFFVFLGGNLDFEPIVWKLTLTYNGMESLFSHFSCQPFAGYSKEVTL